MAYEFIKTENHGQVEILKLNDPATLNAINHQMVDELIQEIEQVEDDPSIRVLILTGEGRGFCSGANFKKMAAGGSAKTVEATQPGIENLTPHLVFVRKAVYKLWKLSKTTIAALNGACITTGVGLSAACDIRIASDKARIGWLFLRRGLPPEDGSLPLMVHLLGYAKAYRLGILGDIISAQEALDMGFLDQVVPHEQLIPTCLDLANQITANVPPMAQQMFKRLAQAALYESYEHVSLLAHEAFNVLVEDPDHHEAVRAFAEKRQTVWSATPTKESLDFQQPAN